MMARMHADTSNQPFDPAAAGATCQRRQGGMNPTAITLTGVAMICRITARSAVIGGRACAYKALPPSEIAGQISNTAHRGGVAVILSERGSS